MAIPRLLLVAILLSLAWTSPARAALWYEAYEQAEEALQAGQWTEAVTHLNEALVEKGDPAVRARTYGMNFTSYFPYYQLGIAYYNLGRLDDATQAFETEVQMGAISGSAADLAELERYRGLVDQARLDAAEAERGRIERLVTNNLDESARLEQAGELADALAAVDKALAVAPDTVPARDARQRLLGELARLEEEQRRDGRIEELVAEGRGQLDSGNLADAASTFSRALDLREDPANRALLDQAQQSLRAQVDERNRRQEIEQGIENATSLEADGDLVGALARLQPVLVLDPENPQVQQLRQRILRAQTDRETQAQTANSLQQLFADAEAQVETGQYQQLLTTANRALAVEPGNRTALGYIATAYREINRQLLGGPIENALPEIRFFNFRESQADGSMGERVADRRFRLRGEVTDATLVDVVVYGPGGEVLRNVALSRQTDDEKLRFVTSFDVLHTLRKGQSIFRVEATDLEGAKAEQEFSVVYAIPLQRTPWPYVTLLVLAVATFWAYRFLGRKRKLNRRFNPYVTGAPVLKDELFFGRERLLSHVLQRIHINSVLLYGERRIGKTSFQHRLKRRLQALSDPEYIFYPIYTDLQGTAEERFWSTLAEDAFAELAPHLDGLEPGQALQEGTEYRYRDFVSDIRKIIGHLKKKNKNKKKTVRVVLLIDEVDELNTYDPRVNQKLRSLFMKTFAENLVAVVSGVGIKKQWEREGSPWYNFFQEIPVKPFQREDAEKLIRVPIQGVFDLESGVVDEILKTTDTRPYLIQKFCAVLVNRLHEEQRHRITLDDVRAVQAQAEA